MIKSPEADEIIDSYKNADHNKQLGKMNVELTKTIPEEVNKKSQLIICTNEERLHLKIETLKKERTEYERNANNKILELQANIEQQKKSQEELKQSFVEERNILLYTIRQIYDELMKEIEKLQTLQKEKTSEQFKKHKYKWRINSCVVT